MAARIERVKDDIAPVVVARGEWQEFWLRLRRDWLAIASAAFLIVLTFLAFIGAPHGGAAHPPPF
jgi:hypothetical protein